MKASVIIPTFNRADQLRITLSSLMLVEYDPTSFEIIVVDNGSTDSTKCVVEKFIIDHPKNCLKYIYDSIPGLLTGRHRGAKESKGEILIFIDDDIKADKNWLKEILATFDGHPDVHLVGGKCLPDFERTPPEWLYYFKKELPDGGWMITDLSLCDYGDVEKEIPATWVWGLNFSIRKESLYKHGGFHPDNIPPAFQHFQGDGETGLSFKLAATGCKTWYNPQIIVEHIVPADRMTFTYFEKRYFYQGVCNSFTEIRQIKGSYSRKILTTFVKMLKSIFRSVFGKKNTKFQVGSDEFNKQVLITRFASMERAGYHFHQKLAWSSPELMKWILREDYFDYKLPEI